LITTRLKAIAIELGITIIILSQLSRAHQHRIDKTPILSDLRDSGSIEQDSNIVILLHRPDKQPSHYNGFEQCIQIIVAKNRSGSSGMFCLKYISNSTKFIQA
jgi:replicative DNA helicase